MPSGVYPRKPRPPFVPGMTAEELRTILREIAFSPKSFARVAPRDYRTIRQWVKAGVPKESVHVVHETVAKIRAEGIKGHTKTGRPRLRERRVLKSELTVERLREVVDYDPTTGIFRWKVHRSCNRIGGLAGTGSRLGYRVINIDGTLYGEHLLAWYHFYGRWPKREIDHKDCDPSNNRIQNLREADRSNQTANTRISARNTSGFKGVTKTKSGKWRAQIVHRGKHYNLGDFHTAEEAADAYRQAAERLHGEFARAA